MDYRNQTYTVASAPTMTGLVFMHRFRLCLGQCGNWKHFPFRDLKSKKPTLAIFVLHAHWILGFCKCIYFCESYKPVTKTYNLIQYACSQVGLIWDKTQRLKLSWPCTFTIWNLVMTCLEKDFSGIQEIKLPHLLHGLYMLPCSPCCPLCCPVVPAMLPCSLCCPLFCPVVPAAP